jgi:hypothetical protein
MVQSFNQNIFSSANIAQPPFLSIPWDPLNITVIFAISKYRECISANLKKQVCFPKILVFTYQNTHFLPQTTA